MWSKEVWSPEEWDEEQMNGWMANILGQKPSFSLRGKTKKGEWIGFEKKKAAAMKKIPP